MAAPWVILHRTLSTEDGRNISVALRALPRVTVLNVPRSVHPDAGRAGKFPYLIAAGPSALLLCFSNISTYDDNTGLMVLRQFRPSNRILRRRATTCVAEDIPRRTGSMPAKYDLGSVGLARPPFGSDYVIAELHQVTRRSERARLLIFTGGRQWFEQKPLYPMSDEERDWASAGVVSHGGKLWWFDLSWGILSCDPSAVNPVLRFHELPPRRRLARFEPLIHRVRCISVSDNEVRYAEIGRYRYRYPDGRFGSREDKVFVWTMTWIPVPASPPRLEWVKSYEMKLSDMWSDSTYTTTSLLVNQVPEILFVSPRQPNVVYFFLDRFVFGVDVAKHRVLKVVNDDAHALFHPTARRCVLPWDLPPSIANDIV